MKNNASSLPLIYGDAEVSFFNIDLNTAISTDSRWHKHAYFEIHVCRRAFADYTFEEKSVTLHEGQVIIIPPNALHLSIDRELHTTTELAVVSFDIKKIKGDKKLFDTFSDALLTYSKVPLSIDKLARLDLGLFYDSASYHTVHGVCRLKAISAEFLNLLFDHIIKDSGAPLYGKQETDILIDNMVILPNVTLDDIAKETNYSKRHVSRIIRAKYGVSLGKLKKQRNR